MTVRLDGFVAIFSDSSDELLDPDLFYAVAMRTFVDDISVPILVGPALRDFFHFPTAVTAFHLCSPAFPFYYDNNHSESNTLDSKKT